MSEERWEIIVVGAGSAGICCAITAADRGARVVVVEKSGEMGGTLHVAGGNMSAAGTRRQRELGIEDSPERHFEDVMRNSGGEADPVIVRLAVEEAPATIDWLDDNGFEFDPETPLKTEEFEHFSSFGWDYSAARTYWGRERARSVLAVLRPLWDDHVAAGKIVPLFDHSLVELLADDGAVVGVRVAGPDGERELRGEAVALTTGGYASNPQLFAELTPGNLRVISSCPVTARGDGLLAAGRLGATIRGAEHYRPKFCVFETERGSERALPADEGKIVPGSAIVIVGGWRTPREIYVNSRGERFMAEDDPSEDGFGNALVRQPGHEFWLVFDDHALEAGTCFYTSPEGDWDAAELRRHARMEKYLWTADTIRGLAGKAGIDADGLERTVAGWNEAVRTGEDPLGNTHLEFPVATPPFYAGLAHATVRGTSGGLTVDGKLRVLDGAGEPIPKLYAAGNIIGAGATMGTGHASGMNLTPALSFGRILGRQLTRERVPERL